MLKIKMAVHTVTTGPQRVKSVTKTSQLMLYSEITAVCSEIRTEHINALCGLNEELLKFKMAVHSVTTGLQRVKSLLQKPVS